MIGQGALNCPNSKSNPQLRTLFTTIDAFGDDLLLKTFSHCRPVLSNEHEVDDNCDLEGRKWVIDRWWHKLAHVCQRWRCLVFASPSQLGLYLLCTYGTLVADMLAYPPAFPLVIDYGDEDRDVTVQDEEAISLALRRRRSVRRIRLWMPSAILRRLLSTLDGEFPMLENLYIKSMTDDDSLSFPNSFNASHIRHFMLRNIICTPVVVLPPPSAPHIPYTEIIGQSTPYYGPRQWRFLKHFIHILDDDSLLNIFRFCRPPVMVSRNVNDINHIIRGERWDQERWWYRPARVCRRWRCLILASAHYLKLCLVCKRGTPVADMLANSPPFPLIIDYIRGHGHILAQDEEGIMLALQHRDRVRRVRLQMPLLNLQKLVLAIDEEFPMLESLCIKPPTKCNSWLIFPATFQAPNLRHLALLNFAIPLRSPLTTTSMNLVTLSLAALTQSAYLHLEDLLQQISLIPLLEILRIGFHSSVPNRELERQLVHNPVTTRATLPKLRWLRLRATSAYMEALLSRITTPLLERLDATFFLQLGLSVPHLLGFISASENLVFGSAKFTFSDDRITVDVHPHDGTRAISFHTDIACQHLDWQVAFTAQLFRTLQTGFSEVTHLTLRLQRKSRSSNINNDVDRTQWRELLRTFRNVNILRINKDFRGQISGSLQVNDGEPPLEILPELKELQLARQFYPQTSKAFKAFIDARQNAGRAVTLVCN